MTGLGLSSAAGLNAYIPILVLGLMDRYTSFVDLPVGWDWLAHPVTLITAGVLCAVEIVADKIPAVDSVNDVIQTFIRPTAGGLVFASGVGEPVRLDGNFNSTSIIMAVIGAVVAFVVHLGKSTTRPVANVATAGFAAPILSAGEDGTSLALAFAAIFAPFIGLLLIVAVIGMWLWLRRARRSMRRALQPERSGGTADRYPQENHSTPPQSPRR